MYVLGLALSTQLHTVWANLLLMILHLMPLLCTRYIQRHEMLFVYENDI
jgi:hypothetical protein